MVGPHPPADFESNGCSFVPDSYGDLDMCAPCHCHDYAYSLGGGWNEFRESNYWFRRNLRVAGAPRFLAWVRWAAVSVAGIPFFNWDAELEPSLPVMLAADAVCRACGDDPRSIGAKHR